MRAGCSTLGAQMQWHIHTHTCMATCHDTRSPPPPHHPTHPVLPQERWTAIHIAAAGGQAPVAELLIAARCDVDFQGLVKKFFFIFKPFFLKIFSLQGRCTRSYPPLSRPSPPYPRHTPHTHVDADTRHSSAVVPLVFWYSLCVFCRFCLQCVHVNVLAYRASWLL